jgi:uncharacterized surface protein with fasciclin (FAS1) repeats
MSRYTFQKSIAATLGVVIVSAGLFAGISSNANMVAQAPASTEKPAPASGDSMKKPGDSMSKPGDSMNKPGDSMSKPGDSMNKPGDSMSKPAKPAMAGKTIAELAISSKSLSTLVAALKAADLVDTLSGEGPFTVFAPTNAAFAKLPKATLAKLLKPENKEMLKKILTYHVIPGKITSKMLKPSQQVETVEGSKVTVKVRGKKVMINNATVLKADVAASNGVVHSIDTVIMPSTK